MKLPQNEKVKMGQKAQEHTESTVASLQEEMM